MPSTSDTEFYSLSLNSLDPPPYSSSDLRPTILANTERSEKEQFEPLTRSFVRRFTPLFLRTASSSSTAERSTNGPTSAVGSHNRFVRLVIDWWLWEIISWFVSALCTFGIALLLGYYDGRSVPDHWPLGITLNAYIAILSGIAKYTLAVPIENLIGQLKWHWMAQRSRPLIDFERFDDASRGPWGALILLIRTKGRTVASIGAIVTILSLAADPFYQQLVDLPKRPSALSQSAVPRMVNFDLQRNVWKNSSSDENIIGSERLLQEVAFSFMVNNGTSRNISAFCPNDQCAWKPFDTLGICSECTDISSMLQLACLEESGEWRKNATITENPTTKVFSCGYFLNATSDNPVLMSGYALNTSSTPAEPLEFLLMRNLNLKDVNYDRSSWGGSVELKQPAFPLVDFIQVASANTSAILRGDAPVARECALRWCTKRLAASYDEGVYSEQVISEAFDTTGNFDPLTITQLYGGTYFNYTKNISITPPESSISFNVPDMTTMSIIMMLQEYTPSYLTALTPTEIPLLRTRNWAEDKPRYWPYAVNPFLDFSQGNQFIQNMTIAMTNMIRSYPGSSEMFKGTGGLETFIRVRWGFFALPALLVCMTLALLVSVIASSRRHRQLGIMKSSILASMANGLSEEVRASFAQTDQLSSILKHSEQLHVALQEKDRTIQLEKV